MNTFFNWSLQLTSQSLQRCIKSTVKSRASQVILTKNEMSLIHLEIYLLEEPRPSMLKTAQDFDTPISTLCFPPKSSSPVHECIFTSLECAFRPYEVRLSVMQNIGSLLKSLPSFL